MMKDRSPLPGGLLDGGLLVERPGTKKTMRTETENKERDYETKPQPVSSKKTKRNGLSQVERKEADAETAKENHKHKATFGAEPCFAPKVEEMNQMPWNGSEEKTIIQEGTLPKLI
ncbi:hypothetical protein GOBAR_DD20627 [Gossypium barbadense]|nr:hypothetical protein GOBAR_DD20627 [Gossypium barbadense]